MRNLGACVQRGQSTDQQGALGPKGVAAGQWEWPTVWLLAACSAAIVALVFFVELPWWLAVPALAVSLALHSSLQHEVLHGHPGPDQRVNEWLVSVPVGLLVPYERFRDTHLAHHVDERLTDPYDDPESNYLDPAAWRRLPRWARALLRANNTLLGRMLLGPLIGMASFYRADLAAALTGDRAVRRAYAVHLLTLLPWWWAVLAFGLVSPWAYFAGAYLALSLLRVRTFLEHRAHRDVRGRTVIIEDRGVFAWLFLNNNLHLVHHLHPQVAWYRLPALYRARREHFLNRNHGYRYPSYGAVFRRYGWRAKDPVPHPLWDDDGRPEQRS